MSPARFATLALLFGVLLPIHAAAQDAPVDDTERAFQLNEQGFAAFEEGRYPDAAKLFAEAFTITGDPALRKNEALAWFRAGDCDQAVAAGNKFLRIDGVTATDHADMHAVIANCKVDFSRRAIDAGDLDLAESMLTEAEALNADAVSRDRIAAARVDLAAARREAEVVKPPPEPEIRTVYVPEPTERKIPVLGISLMGGGGALVAGTIVYHVIALGWQSRFFRLEEGSERGDEATFESLRNRVHLARVLVPTLYTIGAATAGAGVFFTFFMPLDQASVARGDGPSIGIAGQF